MDSHGIQEPAAVCKPPVPLPHPHRHYNSPHLLLSLLPATTSFPFPFPFTFPLSLSLTQLDLFMDSSSSSSSSTSDLEAGYSGCISCVPYHRAAMSGSSLPPPRPRRLFCYAFDDEDDDFCEPRHFLDSCSLCRKPLARNRDIFMYRGDTPFCSEECRQERIEIDEAKEKSWKLSAKASSATKGQGQQQNSAKSQKIHVRASTAVAG